MDGKSADTPHAGPTGRLLRLLAGVGLLAVAVAQGIAWEDAAIGLGAVPAGLLLLLRLRGRPAPRLRITGPAGHGLVVGLGAAFVVLAPVAALLFAGSSLVLAASRGDVGCELLAIPNGLLRRNDEVACPVFSPIDALEVSRREKVRPR